MKKQAIMSSLRMTACYASDCLLLYIPDHAD
jgi:hypothetical protein